MPYIDEQDEHILRRLREPFSPDVVGWRPGTVTKQKDKAMALAYIDARDVQDRLNEVCGPNWNTKPIITPARVICELTITFPSGRVTTRADGVWAGNMEVARTGEGKVEKKEEDRVTMEGKEAFSVALKRAAVSFGIGRYLYDLPSPWEPIDNFQKFTGEAVQRLQRVAAKPYEDWRRAMERARRERGEGPLPPPPDPRPQPEPEPHDDGPPPQREDRPASSPRGDTQRQAAPQAAAPFDISTVPEGQIRDVVLRFEREVLSPDDTRAFHEILSAWRETWVKGSPEYGMLMAAVVRASKRAQIKPREK